MGQTKYKAKFINQVVPYINSKKDTYDEKGKLKKVNLPTLDDFAVNYLRVSPKIIYNWEKVYPKFRIALDKIRQVQKQKLIDEGLSGRYNPAIAKLILSNNHGMREKTDVTTDDKPINTFSDDQVNRIAERIARRRNKNGDTSGS